MQMARIFSFALCLLLLHVASARLRGQEIDETTQAVDVLEIMEEQRLLNDVSSEKEEELQSMFPTMTKQEILFSLIDNDNDLQKAINGLKKYKKWRKKSGLDKKSTKRKIKKLKGAEDTWELANQLTFKNKKQVLPQALTMPVLKNHERLCSKDKEVTYTLHGGRINLDLASAAEWAKVGTLFFALSTQRDSMVKWAVLLDVRGIFGERNHRSSELISVGSKFADLIAKNFPGRLGKCLAYPMPTSASTYWNAVNKHMTPRFSKTFYFISGDRTDCTSPTPKGLSEFFEDDQYSHCLDEERNKLIEYTPTEDEIIGCT